MTAKLFLASLLSLTACVTSSEDVDDEPIDAPIGDGKSDTFARELGPVATNESASFFLTGTPTWSIFTHDAEAGDRIDVRLTSPCQNRLSIFVYNPNRQLINSTTWGPTHPDCATSTFDVFAAVQPRLETTGTYSFYVRDLKVSDPSARVDVFIFER